MRARSIIRMLLIQFGFGCLIGALGIAMTSPEFSRNPSLLPAVTLSIAFFTSSIALKE